MKPDSLAASADWSFFRAAVLDRAGLPVMAVEIEVERGVVPLRPHEEAQHADDLRALLVDGGGVEIVDLDIALGPDVMRQRARILAELAGAQRQDIVDALDRALRMSAENC
jgi:hypothetical protein